MKRVLKSKKTNFIFLIILTFVVLYFSLKDNFFEIIKQIKDINLVWLLISFLLLIGYWLFSSVAMKLITDKFNKKVSLKSIFRINVITQFFNGVTPSSSGGQPYQIYALKRSGLTLVDSTNVSIQTFVCYQFALVLLGFIAFLFNRIFNLFAPVKLLKLLVILGFIVNILIAAFLFMITITKKINKKVINGIIKLGTKFKIIKNREDVGKKLNNSVEQFQQGTYLLLKDKKLLLVAVICQFMGLICFYSIPLALLLGMGSYQLNLGLSIIVTAYVMVAGSFVPLPGGTGGLEYAFLTFFGNFIGGSTLTALMLMWRFVTYYLGMIIGGIMLNIGKKEKFDGK